jgi:hypothetical protein
MPTTKTRINVTPSDETYAMIKGLAERDGQSVATKAMDLLLFALELEEDSVLGQLASERDTKDATWISHEDTWI